jgi:hypothetical protein
MVAPAAWSSELPVILALITPFCSSAWHNLFSFFEFRPF